MRARPDGSLKRATREKGEQPHSSTLASPLAGAFQEIRAELAVPRADIHANIFVPEGLTMADVLNDERRFVSLRNVEGEGSVETYGYLAVGKKQIVVMQAHSHEPSAQEGPMGSDA